MAAAANAVASAKFVLNPNAKPFVMQQKDSKAAKFSAFLERYKKLVLSKCKEGEKCTWRVVLDVKNIGDTEFGKRYGINKTVICIESEHNYECEYDMAMTMSKGLGKFVTMGFEKSWTPKEFVKVIDSNKKINTSMNARDILMQVFEVLSDDKVKIKSYINRDLLSWDVMAFEDQG